MVTDVADGYWILGSEEQVRDAGHEFLRAAFKAAVQQKAAAAESAFPPPQDSQGRKPSPRVRNGPRS